MEGAIALHHELLDQLATFLADLDGASYIALHPPISEFSISSHVRHLLEFYECLFEGLETGRIDYDARKRDPVLESDRDAAASRIAELMPQLEMLDEDAPLGVTHDRTRGGSDVWASSLRRELQFVAGHTVHHLAIIGIMAKHSGRAVPQDFGVAASTLVHRQRTELGLS